MNNIEEIQATLPREELLLQLAEECTELAKAAMKLRRAETKINPTPTTTDEAYKNLLEEIADVALCLKVLGIGTPEEMLTIHRTMILKEGRWAMRLNEREKKENDHA